MSLIDEALKRAREQAEREGAERRSAASRWVPAYPLARRRSRALVWAGLAAGCLLLGVGAGLVASRFTGERTREGGIQLPEDEATGTADPGIPLGAGAVLLEETTATTDAFGVPFPLPSTAPPGVLEPELVPEPVPEPVPPPAAGPEPAAPELAPVPPPAAEPPAGATTHVRRAPIPGGGTLELGGIAFSANPVALLNGRVVSVGEVVEGFTVTAIEPRRVELRGHSTTIFLTLD